MYNQLFQLGNSAWTMLLQLGSYKSKSVLQLDRHIFVKRSGIVL